MINTGPLTGRGIVVTRPAQQAGALAAMISAAGGHPILFPVLEILDAADPGALIKVIDRLDDFDLAVFISPNAVQRAMSRLAAHRAWPAGLRAAVVGQGSARELQHFGVADVIAPVRGADSEHLLELPQLQAVAGQRVIIFRGNGGRELLSNTLAARGATVEYVECYRRARPKVDVEPLLAAWARDEVHAVIVTSSEGLRNLCAMVGTQGLARLQRTPLLVTHPRIAQVAHELECSNVVETAPGDDDLLQGLRQLFDPS